jgi:hypothetical protein
MVCRLRKEHKALREKKARKQRADEATARALPDSDETSEDQEMPVDQAEKGFDPLSINSSVPDAIIHYAFYSIYYVQETQRNKGQKGEAIP